MATSKALVDSERHWPVFSTLEPCPYLPGAVACMPLRLPPRQLSAAELDQALAQGDRRSGRFLYRPQCPSCQACEAIRVEVDQFTLSRGQRRTKLRGDNLLRVTLRAPAASRGRVELFNRHLLERNLGSAPTTASEYRAFLVDTCCDSFELAYQLGSRLVGVAICDRGAAALSAVYCYFAPEMRQLGLGTYSILRQIDLCRRWGLKYLYLGLYVAANRHLSYKDRFRPHERLIAGRWERFAR
jgi:leucyl-tRNA---protein transferase